MKPKFSSFSIDFYQRTEKIIHSCSMTAARSNTHHDQLRHTHQQLSQFTIESFSLETSWSKAKSHIRNGSDVFDFEFEYSIWCINVVTILTIQLLFNVVISEIMVPGHMISYDFWKIPAFSQYENIFDKKKSAMAIPMLFEYNTILLFFFFTSGHFFFYFFHRICYVMFLNSNIKRCCCC